jgi:DHA3 family macrolide efflux protein-like MFS transporter
LVTTYFNKGALDLSLLESAFSAGMILGGVILSAWGGFRRNINTILTGLLGMGLGIGLIALSPANRFSLAAVGMGLSGLMIPTVNGPIAAIIQKYAEPHMQGRVFSIQEGMVSAMMPLGMLIAAPVAEWIGIRGWLLVGAAGCLIMGIAGFFIPALLHLEDQKNGADSAKLSKG